MPVALAEKLGYERAAFEEHLRGEWAHEGLAPLDGAPPSPARRSLPTWMYPHPSTGVQYIIRTSGRGPLPGQPGYRAPLQADYDHFFVGFERLAHITRHQVPRVVLVIPSGPSDMLSILGISCKISTSWMRGEVDAWTASVLNELPASQGQDDEGGHPSVEVA